MNSQTASAEIPSRFARPGFLSLLLYIAGAWLVVNAFGGAGISVVDLKDGVPYMVDLLDRMIPPDTNRLASVFDKLVETLQMAIAGTILGVFFSIPLAVLASKSQSPHRLVYYLGRGVISFFRTVPDLVWALFFVATVGLGPFAGTLTLMVDTIGFCGRFFAESMEEADKGPQEALVALGAGRIAVICCSVFPLTLPSFINSSLFSLEKAVRSSVVLGLVGAGGIGVELGVSMQTLQYDQAATIILAIFLLVMIVEQISSRIRNRIIG